MSTKVSNCRVSLATIVWLCGALLLVLSTAMPLVATTDVGQEEDLVPVSLPKEDLPKLFRGDGYVSHRACQECHTEQHASWHASYHRSMTQLATPESVMGDFDGTVIHSQGVDYKVFERDGKYWAKMPDPDKVMDLVQMRGREEMMAKIPKVERQVIMTTGSHHYQTYWVAGDDAYGRLLQTLPLVYLPKEKQWIPREEAFMRPPGDRFLTQWNHHCIKCHSTGGVPGLVANSGRGEFDTRVADLGISCEACHGPGEEHLAYHDYVAMDLIDPTKTPDPIVNPENLDHVRSTHICGQCHGVFVAKDAKAGIEYATKGEQFLPGDNLFDTRYYIFHPENVEGREEDFEENKEFFRERWWDDGSILAGGREFTAMSGSGCYKRGEISCLSCHAMHDYADPGDQLTLGLDDNAMCTQCHTEAQYTTEVAQHTHHPAESGGSDCLNCHMPFNSYALFSAIRSHQISSPKIAASINHGTPNACNLCHLDQSLDWAQQQTAEWYEHELVEVTPEQQELAAGVLWLLKGDAAQRAVVAWNAGWGPAQEACGDDWLAPYISRLLDDPYGVVRYIATKTLQGLPGYEDFEFNFQAEVPELNQKATAAIEAWPGVTAGAADPRRLLDAQGGIDRQRFDALYAERDDRPVTIKE